MNLRAEILKEHSKSNTIKLAKWVGKDITRFHELMKIFLHDDYRVVQRAAWVVGQVAEEHPRWINRYMQQMLEYCEQAVPDSVKRNVMRVIQNIKIPKNLQGLAATVCFKLVASSKEPVAVKVFSMTVLANLTKEEPELKGELKALITEQIELESAAFKSRGSSILKML